MSSETAAIQDQQRPKDGREVEWQLASTDLGSVRRWLTDHSTVDGLVLEPRPTLQILDTYLDTVDWRIHRAGFALRIRSESGKSEATLKSLHSASSAVADRRELSESLENSESDAIRHLAGPVGTRVQAVSGAQALLPLFEVRTSRQRFAIRREDETRLLGEIALDDTVFSRPHGEPQTSLQRVEVESLTESHEPLQTLVKTLRSDCALAAAPDTKYSQGLKSVGLAPAPAPEFAPTAIDASMTVAEIALANLRRYLSAWNLCEPGARLGDDLEALHDMRLAGRRLESILSEFRASLPAPPVQIRPTLKKVLGALGNVRDLDVALQELDAFGRKLPVSDQQSVDALRKYLESERSRARTRMLSVLDSVPVQKSLQTLTALLAEPSPALQQSPNDPALQMVRQMVRLRYRKVRKGAERLKPDSSIEAYHKVRGRVKKLRYMVEAVAVIYGKPAHEMLRALHRWQQQLGLQQDSAVASRRLKVLAGAPPKGMPSETIFLMGRLAEHYAGAAARARRTYAKRYRKVRGRWKKLRMTMQASAANAAVGTADAGP
jgi:CHAD domain-containing protein